MDPISIVITESHQEARDLFREAAIEDVDIVAMNYGNLTIRYSDGVALRFVSKNLLPNALLGMNVVQVMNLVRGDDYSEINDFAQSRVRG